MPLWSHRDQLTLCLNNWLNVNYKVIGPGIISLNPVWKISPSHKNIEKVTHQGWQVFTYYATAKITFVESRFFYRKILILSLINPHKTNERNAGHNDTNHYCNHASKSLNTQRDLQNVQEVCQRLMSWIISHFSVTSLEIVSCHMPVPFTKHSMFRFLFYYLTSTFTI